MLIWKPVIDFWVLVRVKYLGMRRWEAMFSILLLLFAFDIEPISMRNLADLFWLSIRRRMVAQLGSGTLPMTILILRNIVIFKPRSLYAVNRGGRVVKTGNA